MKKIAIALLVVLVSAGCAFKEMQRPDLVGDSQTKLYYKNVPTNEAKIPSGQRMYFKNMDEAMQQGYKSAQEGGSSADTASAE